MFNLCWMLLCFGEIIFILNFLLFRVISVTGKQPGVFNMEMETCPITSKMCSDRLGHLLRLFRKVFSG